MIVRPADGALHLITQPDHAALARRVMEHWRPLADHARHEVILLAIEQHDNGWREPDEAPLVDRSTGRPADFIRVRVDVRRGVWPRGCSRAAAMHPWAGALIAHHAISVYQRFQQDPDWSAFFADMEATRARLIEASALTLEALGTDYVFLRLGDLVSLTFCTGWDEEPHHSGTRVRRVDGRLIVDPDPFDGVAIPFSVPARVLADRSYGSDAELRTAYRVADTIELSGVVAGATQTGTVSPSQGSSPA